MRSLIVGRFQPFHNGHAKLINEISKTSDELIVVIGSAQYSYTLENPFTAGERVAMITAALKGSKFKEFYVIPIEDVDSNQIWVSHLEAMVPKFGRVYANNPLVKVLFREKGYEVKTTKLFNRDEESGTNIRRLMIDGGNWKKLVPETVASVINSIKGDERLRQLSEKDE